MIVGTLSAIGAAVVVPAEVKLLDWTIDLELNAVEFQHATRASIVFEMLRVPIVELLSEQRSVPLK